MKKSELRQLIKETIEEMASNPRRVEPTRKQKADLKSHKLIPSKDPIMDGEMELWSKGKLIALIWPSVTGGGTRYMTFPEEEEYEQSGSVNDVASWLLKNGKP